VALGVGEPQEDEFTLCSLTGRAWPMAWAFPRRADHYGRYLTMRETSASEAAEWKSALAGLVRKLSFKYGKPLVLKSPGHTCRIRLLLELFPEAPVRPHPPEPLRRVSVHPAHDSHGDALVGAPTTGR
jgi:omega-hydroxy-beta-dihydromenaquinone-9 sulfotransferase